MDKEKQIEALKYNIDRFDHYYASVNFKSSFLIIANITILGFLFTNESTIKGWLLVITALISAATIFFVLLAIKPYLKSHKDKNSLLYFGDIANQKNTFENHIKIATEDSYIKDLTKQTVILAEGLKYKFDMLNIATIIFIINIIIYFLIIIF